MINSPEKESYVQKFVTYIIERVNKNKGIAAILRRADNPDTEYQCWEYLTAFNVDLENNNKRLSHAVIAASIAKAKISSNGNLGIGQAIAKCYEYEKGNESDAAKAKLRRLLACDSVKELCRVLRPIFSLINSKGITYLDFAALLDDLLNFHWHESRQRIKARWAQDFYRNLDSLDEETP